MKIKNKRRIKKMLNTMEDLHYYLDHNKYWDRYVRITLQAKEIPLEKSQEVSS